MRRSLFSAVLAFLALTLLASSWSGQTGTAQTGEACRTCAGAGIVTCSAHRAVDLELERDGVLCTFYAGCVACAGTWRVDCPGCDAPPTAPDVKERERRATFAKHFARYGEIAGRPVLGAATARFNLVCELEPMRAEGRRRNQHELLHLYVERLERLHDAYSATFGLGADALTARSEVFLWAKREDNDRLGRELCGYTTDDPTYRRGLEAVSSLWLDPRKMPDDVALHHNVVHQVVHGMMNVQQPVGFTGKLRMGWADEGLSLWVEDSLFGTISGYCFWSEEVPGGLGPGKWRPALRKRLAEGEPLDLAALLEMDSINLTREQQALGFSLIDFLAARDRALLGKLLERLRGRTPARDAFVEIYGQTVAQIETGWRAWVAKNYPKR